eukprot:3269728-Rhodomonas_salina.2
MPGSVHHVDVDVVKLVLELTSRMWPPGRCYPSMAESDCLCFVHSKCSGSGGDEDDIDAAPTVRSDARQQQDV